MFRFRLCRVRRLLAQASLNRSQLPRRGGFTPLSQCHLAQWTRRAPTRRASHFLHTPAAPAAGFHLSNGSSFRSAPDQHRVSPRASQLLTESPTLAPIWLPHQVVGRQGFPRYVPATAVNCAAVLSVAPSLRLPRLTWFQSREIPKPMTYSARLVNELPITSFEATAQPTSTQLP